MRYAARFCLITVLATSSTAVATVLDYTVVGLRGELQQNVLAWLGEAPATPQQRANFLASAEQRVDSGLRALGYYRADINLEIQRTEPVWTLEIQVEPGQPVLIHTVSIQLSGEADRDPEFTRLVSETPLTTGDVLDHGDYDRFKNQLLSLGQQRGYFEAGFSRSSVAVNTAAGTADIYLHYDSGPRYRFGAVNYVQDLVDPELVRSLQPFADGDYFNQPSLATFQAQLQRTRYFSGVMLRPRLDQAKENQVPLELTLYPARRHSFDVGVGYSTDTQERLSFIWRTPRINNRGHSQETRIAWSTVNPSGRLVYSIPLGNPLDDVVHLSVLAESDKYGDLDSRQKQLGVRREVRQGNWLHSYSVRALEESWEIKNTKFDNSYLLPGYSLARSDRRGSLVNPTHGFRQVYQVEIAGEQFGSDVDLLRATADLSYIFTPAPRHRIVGRAELGAAFMSDSDRAKLAPSLNFFAGGSQSIRGYGYQSVGNEVTAIRDDGSRQQLVVGGDRLVTASLEYQYSFTDAWRGALFVDAGDAFDAGDFDLKVGPGFGIHYVSPVGAIRLEFAYGADEADPDWRLHLNIGAEF